MQKQDDIFLAKWLANELSEKELEAFKASEHYDLYQKIAEGSTQYIAPEYNLEASFEQLKNKRANRTKTRSYSWLRYATSVAAVLVLSLLVYDNFFAPTTYTTGFGEKLVVDLPDGSKVHLNAKSTLSFNKNDWKENRELDLKGEAFFDVEKGKTFTVATSKGNVTVLGTEFNVIANSAMFEVVCYEGKVKVEDKVSSEVNYLTPHNGYRHLTNKNADKLVEEALKPTWLNNQSTFKSLPIKLVFKSLEDQYNIQIKYSQFNDEQLFTGSFPNNNQTIALETVLKSVNLEYSIQGKTIVIEE